MILLAATFSAAGAAVWKWGKRGEPGNTAAALTGPPALFSIFLLATMSVAHMLTDVWSSVRLAPSVSMLRGYRLYYPEGEGPILGWIYGPVMPLLQLPAAALPNPMAAIVAAGILNDALFLLPLLFLIWSVLPRSLPDRMAGILILGTLQGLMMHVETTLYWLRQIQVDTCAIGLALLSLGVLLQADPSRPISRGRLWTSALLLCAAIFSKQTEFFLAPLPILYVWVRDDRRQALRMTLALLAAGAGGALLCGAAFGWDAVVLNVWRVPSRHPWILTGFAGFLEAGIELFHESARFLLLFLGLAVFDLRCGPKTSTLRERVRTRPWLVPAAGALLLLPISLMGRLKIGGDVNASHFLYFLIAAIGMLTARVISVETLSRFQRWAPVLALFLLGTSCYFAFSGGIRFGDSPLERDYRFSQEHPEEVWFGANPLVTLYTDRKLYHQGYGVYDRFLANYPPPARQLQEHLPARMHWVTTVGAPWWVPEDLVEIPTPQGWGRTLWLEKRPPR